MLSKCRLFVLAIFLLPLIIACGNPGTGGTGGTTGATTAPAANGQPSPIVTEAPAVPAVTAAPAVTEAPATTAMAETAMPAETAANETATAAGGAGTGRPLKVGLVTDVGRLDDKSFNESAWRGAQDGAKAIGGESRAIETQDPNDYQKNINQFVTEGYDVIVTVGFALGEATIEAAKANPNVHFIGVDQFQAEEVSNVTGLVFEEDKAGFLAGALAGLYSKSGNIGAVLATDLVPPVYRFGEGYRAGIQHVKPDANLQLVYHSDVGIEKTFTDPEWGKATALSMLDQGVDVLFGAGGLTGNGALFAVAERKDSGAVAIGVDTDQYFTVPEAQPVLLSSAMKIIDKGVADLIRQVSEGTIKGGNYNGEVGLAPFHDFDDDVSDEIKTRLEEIRQQLDDGTLKTNVAPAKPAQ
jgi:basic membrane protein A and related proteins